jgi:beta-xylosidase
VTTSATYTNPVHPDSFPDPFVLAVDGGYLAYATDLRRTGRPRVIPILRSTDLVTWTPGGDALERLDDPAALDYWAPEVVEEAGRYYMYFTAGTDDRGHRIRVATADRPEGPFRDTGRVLTGDEPFSIDAHPFRDDDGTWYLYYARDFLDGERVGTALVVDRMVDMRTLAGEPRTVLRASADWQLFLRDRPMYGGIHDWYTLEGPFVVKRDGRYWCFYSGGSWKTAGYGVSWAVADGPLGPFVEAPSDGPALLRGIPGKVLGPGHNCVIRGPDGGDRLVYHAWDQDRTARRMCLDRLWWTADGPVTDAPTTTPQPVPAPA